jgi:hypothetical protein
MEDKTSSTKEELEAQSLSDSFPALYVFKFFNAFSLVLLYSIVMWNYAHNSDVLKLIFPFSMFAGLASIFIPAKKSNIKIFKVLSYILYCGLVLSFFA